MEIKKKVVIDKKSTNEIIKLFIDAKGLGLAVQTILTPLRVWIANISRDNNVKDQQQKK